MVPFFVVIIPTHTQTQEGTFFSTEYIPGILCPLNDKCSRTEAAHKYAHLEALLLKSSNRR